MKTLIITALLTVLLSVATAFGQDTNNLVLTNIETTEDGDIKEMVFLNDETLEVERKTVYHYNNQDQLLMKVNYSWVSRDGWRPVQKYEYTYNLEGKTATVAHTSWNIKKKEWADNDAEMMAYIYTEDGELVAIK